MIRRVARVLAVLALAGSCAADNTDNLVEILERHRSAIMAAPGVTGVGLGRCDPAPCIKVFASERSATLVELLDEHLGDAPYQIVVTDPFRARPDADEAEP